MCSATAESIRAIVKIVFHFNWMYSQKSNPTVTKKKLFMHQSDGLRPYYWIETACKLRPTIEINSDCGLRIITDTNVWRNIQNTINYPNPNERKKNTICSNFCGYTQFDSHSFGCVALLNKCTQMKLKRVITRKKYSEQNKATQICFSCHCHLTWQSAHLSVFAELFRRRYRISYARFQSLANWPLSDYSDRVPQIVRPNRNHFTFHSRFDTLPLSSVQWRRTFYNCVYYIVWNRLARRVCALDYYEFFPSIFKTLNYFLMLQPKLFEATT